MARLYPKDGISASIHPYDAVKLSDGRTGAVVEVLGDGEAFLVDTGSSPADWDTEYITQDKIVEILNE